MDTTLDFGGISLFDTFDIVKHCSSDRFIVGVDGLDDRGWFDVFCLPLSPLGEGVSLFNHLPAEVGTFIANEQVTWPWNEPENLVLPFVAEGTMRKGECLGFFAIPHEFP